MSWQDELRRLDHELTSGRLTPMRHRKLREAVLATVSTEGPPPVAPPVRRPPPPPPEDLFRTVPRTRPKPTWLLLPAGLLVVLALIIGGTLWLGSSDDTAPGTAAVPTGAPGAPSAVQDPSAPAAPPTSLEDRLPVLPGVASDDNSTMSIAKGAELRLYPQDAVQKLLGTGAAEVVCDASTDGQDAYLVLAFPTTSPANAQAIAAYLGQGAVSSGFTRTPDSRFTATGDQAGRSMTGTWYASGDVAVVVWVSQVSGGQQATLADKFGRTLSAAQRALPPG
jgi:hypothetical protein